MCGSPTKACSHGPPPAKTSYLNIPAILAACEITGADAVHPGYGFLSENARFAEILADHNVHFIGPRPEHIRLMGDKIAAKRAAKDLGIPVVPGSDSGVADDEALHLARDIGFPVMVKAAAGGGGRGMKLVRTEADMSSALAMARAEFESRLRRRYALSGKISRTAAPHRDPGPRRRQGARHSPRRA